MPKAKLDSAGEMISLYAAGALDPAFCLMLETQATLRPDIAQAIAQAERISGILLETETPAVVSSGALEAALANIEAFETSQQTQSATLTSAAAYAAGALDEVLALPEPLRDAVLNASLKQDWKSLTRGVKRLTLDIDSPAEVELYRIEPGRKLIHHTHRSTELTLVVAGGYTDETGQFARGDLSVKGPKDAHQPVADPGEVCFALAVRNDGLQFTGLLGAVQRLLGQ